MTRSRVAAALIATAGAFSLSACGGGESTATALAEAHGGPMPARFDAYSTGSVIGDVRNADIYGITFNPLRAYRLTTGKRISFLSADAKTVVVAAADQGIDMLGQLGTGGAIVEIPGLGRPHAFGPEIQPGGTIRYEDNEGEGRKDARYLSWNPRTGKTRVLYRESGTFFGGVHRGPGDQFLFNYQDRGELNRVGVVRKGHTTTYAIAPTAGDSSWGARFISVSVLEPGSGFGPATGTVLIDPAIGKRIEVPGWSPIAWSPDGTRLLVQRTGGAASAPSELAVLDPADPSAPRSLGTIPHLTLYQGSWVRS